MARKNRNVEIVPYSAEFRDTVRHCVYETGYGGDSAEIYFEDRDLFADFLTLYYTDYEPESAFIPLVDGEPAGYLLGCLDTARSEEITKRKVYPLIMKKLLSGKYNVGPGVIKNIARALEAGLRGENNSAPLDVYPAHLHIDLFHDYRRLGLGRLLIETYIDHLRGKGIPGVHLGTSSFHTLALPFYEKLGFQRYSATRITRSFFDHLVDRDFYNVCYVKHIHRQE